VESASALLWITHPDSVEYTDWTGNINVFMGGKQLEEDDWEPLDEQDEYGIMLDFKQESWPISIAIDFLSSSDKQTCYYIAVQNNLIF